MTKRLKERFDTLSDAIIAIVMTILVLEIKLPTSMAGLPHFAYAVGLFLVSFVIIFNFWYRRTIIMSVAEEVTYDAFARDVIAHMMLSLFPLATKMLVEFDQKWVPILFFGLINFVTAFLMSWITLKYNTPLVVTPKLNKGRQEEDENPYLIEEQCYNHG